MKNVCSKLVCALLAAILVAGLSAQAFGSGQAIFGYGPSGDDCCCSEPATDTTPSCGDLENGCCPEPGQTDDSPCSCACSSCSAMSRTVNLFSVDIDFSLLFTRDAQLLVLMPNRLPASAVLGVDIQPPIA
ncbi:MAG: hypothetical protein KTR15_00390 [Phycisphaeraceae bacterium]|nr:hypothetical protein [Phycisphaeraceae bacterium]